jgi:arylsulfatase A-like enzyme
MEISIVLRDQLRGEIGREAAAPALVERWVEYSLDAYDAEIAYFDTAFGELLDLLGRHGVLDDALLVFTSDHGEEFLEHGLVTHGPHLYDETVRVPLFITGFGPSALDPGRVTTAVETREILPTLAEHLGLPAPSYAITGRNLLEPRPGTVFSQTMHGVEPGFPGFSEKQSMATDQWKLIRSPASGRVELYDLVADPRESVDLAQERPRIRDAMLEELDRWVRATTARRPDNQVRDNPEATARLQALGYLGR